MCVTLALPLRVLGDLRTTFFRATELCRATVDAPTRKTPAMQVKKILAQGGTDPSAADSKGMTALHYAAQADHKTILQVRMSIPQGRAQRPAPTAKWLRPSCSLHRAMDAPIFFAASCGRLSSSLRRMGKMLQTDSRRKSFLEVCLAIAGASRGRGESKCAEQ